MTKFFMTTIAASILFSSAAYAAGDCFGCVL